MTNSTRKILRSRFLEYNGYKNKEIKILNYKKQLVGNLFSFMPVVVMTIFVFVAFFIGVWYTQYRGQLTADGSGLQSGGVFDNFRRLKLDKEFQAAVKNSLKYTSIVVGFSISWSLIIASMINVGKIRGKKAFLLIYFLPQVTSEIAATIVFYRMMSSTLDLANKPANTFWVIALLGVWATTSSSLVIFNTAFANIGKTEFEAASLDGANEFVKFFKITLPAVAPIVAYQLVMTLIGGMTAFGASYYIIANGLVTGESVRSIILWPVAGFIRISGGVKGQGTNVGLGMWQLILLGVTVVGLVVVANFIQPIQGRK